MFRIQKILLAEYQEIYEPILVESPFAEVTEDGIGIKQVQLALTPTRIIIGHDVFEKNSQASNVSLVEKDAEIECFELLNVLPLDVLKIWFFKKGSRSIMNLTIFDERIVFYEFGGYLRQNLFWNTWRERITTLRHTGANLYNISNSSPFSSSDIIADEEEITASTYPSPRSYHSTEYESALCSDPRTSKLSKRSGSTTHADEIEKASNMTLSPDMYQMQQIELQNYLSSLNVTNTFSCGCNTSW